MYFIFSAVLKIQESVTTAVSSASKLICWTVFNIKKEINTESLWRIVSGLLLLLSWLPIYLYASISIEIFELIRNNEYKNVNIQIVKAEKILNWFVAIKISLAIVFCVGTVSDKIYMHLIKSGFIFENDS